MTLDNMDAKGFDESNGFYESEFVRVLAMIVACYKMLISNNKKVANDEKSITKHLYCNYLCNNEIRETTCKDFLFFSDALEYGVTEGKPDIRVIGMNRAFFDDADAYYLIECKRVHNQNRRGISGLNSEYIKEGILRYVNKKYSVHGRLNGMLGYVVEKMDIDENINDINYLLQDKFPESKTVERIKTIEEIEAFEYQYSSRHQDIEDNEFKLYHLMLDLSDNIG